jgi:dTMP kinase
LRRAAQFPQRVRVIDSTRAIADIQQEIAQLLDAV